VVPSRTVIFRKEGQIGIITLNRPGVGNAINNKMAGQLVDVCSRIAEDREVRVVLITGQGKSFCLGADPKEKLLFTKRDKSSPAQLLARLNCPTIAAINGDALSWGLELALVCDIRIADETASFGFPEVALGLMPQDGGTQWLPRLVGRAKALEMLLTAEPIDAQEAYRIGLVSKVVPETELIPLTMDIARKISSKAPVALSYIKEAVSKGLDLTLEQGLGLETDLYCLLQITQDRIEGIRAFREKRSPHFKGE